MPEGTEGGVRTCTRTRTALRHCEMCVSRRAPVLPLRTLSSHRGCHSRGSYSILSVSPRASALLPLPLYPYPHPYPSLVHRESQSAPRTTSPWTTMARHCSCCCCCGPVASPPRAVGGFATSSSSASASMAPSEREGWPCVVRMSRTQRKAMRSQIQNTHGNARRDALRAGDAAAHGRGRRETRGYGGVSI